ncbi:MAG: hypothetical protein IRZ11_08235 [Clostridia bacterium]|nr:hypothetical protein [Clostridia bacterium]
MTHAPLGLPAVVASEVPLAEASSSGVTLAVASLVDSDAGLLVELTLADGASVPVHFFWRDGWAREGDRQVRPIPSPQGDAPADVVEAGGSTRGQILLPGLHAGSPIRLEVKVQPAAAVAPFGDLFLSVTLPGGSG